MKNIPFSKRIFKYILHPTLYVFAGGVVAVMFVWILEKGNVAESILLRDFSIMGMVAAFCFYIVSISINKMIQVSSEQEEER